MLSLPPADRANRLPVWGINATVCLRVGKSAGMQGHEEYSCVGRAQPSAPKHCYDNLTIWYVQKRECIQVDTHRSPGRRRETHEHLDSKTDDHSTHWFAQSRSRERTSVGWWWEFGSKNADRERGCSKSDEMPSESTLPFIKCWTKRVVPDLWIITHFDLSLPTFTRSPTQDTDQCLSSGSAFMSRSFSDNLLLICIGWGDSGVIKERADIWGHGNQLQTKSLKV